MSRPGAGRGRGWLKLEKDPPCPGLDESVKLNLETEIKTPQESEDFSELIGRFELLDASDDGITANQKIKYIVECWEKMDMSSKDPNWLDKSLKAVFQTCLLNEELIETVVQVCTSSYMKTFHDKANSGKNFVRRIFLTNLQELFDKAELWKNTNPTMFHSSIKLLSSAWTYMIRDESITKNIVGVSITGYILHLLDRGTTKDIKLILFLIFNHSMNVEPKLAKNSDIKLKIKLLLVSENRLDRNDKLMLLLALELIEKDLVIYADSLAFYKEHINEVDLKEFLPELEKRVQPEPVERYRPYGYSSANEATVRLPSNHPLLVRKKKEQPAVVDDQTGRVGRAIRGSKKF